MEIRFGDSPQYDNCEEKSENFNCHVIIDDFAAKKKQTNYF